MELAQCPMVTVVMVVWWSAAGAHSWSSAD
jgi:hypothetical protein